MQNSQNQDHGQITAETKKIPPSEESKIQEVRSGSDTPQDPSAVPSSPALADSFLGKRLAKESGLPGSADRDLEPSTNRHSAAAVSTTNVATATKRMNIIRPTHTPGTLAAGNNGDFQSLEPAFPHISGAEQQHLQQLIPIDVAQPSDAPDGPAGVSNSNRMASQIKERRSKGGPGRPKNSTRRQQGAASSSTT